MILSNQVECLKCGDKPFSAHRHDFKPCRCGSVAVDGGLSYLRRVGDMSPGATKDISIEIDDQFYFRCKEAAQWCIDTDRNALGIVCALFRAIRDAGYKVVESDNG